MASHPEDGADFGAPQGNIAGICVRGAGKETTVPYCNRHYVYNEGPCLDCEAMNPGPTDEEVERAWEEIRKSRSWEQGSIVSIYGCHFFQADSGWYLTTTVPDHLREGDRAWGCYETGEVK